MPTKATKLSWKQRRGFRVGDIVAYHSLIGGPITSTGHEIKDFGKLGDSGVVVWITKHSGCVSIDAISFITRKEALGS